MMKKLFATLLTIMAVATVFAATSTSASAATYNDHLTSAKKTVSGKQATVKHNGNIYKVKAGKLVKTGKKTNSVKTKILKVTKKASASLSNKNKTMYYIKSGSTKGWVKSANLKLAKKGAVPASKVIKYANKFKGTPYVWGGTTPRGFDCSGFTQYVFKKTTGKNIGRTAANQAMSRGAKRISAKSAKAGDLLIWSKGGAGTAYHVGLATGKSTWINAFRPGRGLGNASLATYYNRPSFAIRLDLNKLPNA